MTFGQIATIVPLTTNLRGFGGEHGGVWYGVPLGTNTFVQLRFEHPRGVRNPSGKSNILDCILNYPPRLTGSP